MAYPKVITATTQVKVGAGRLNSITVSSTTSGTITIYDEDQGGATNVILATITPAAGFHAFFGDEGLVFSKGLNIVTTNTISATIGYK